MLAPSMTCCVCGPGDAHCGVLCASWREALVGQVSITTEQIEGSTGMPSPAVLVDVWGGIHRLSPDTLVGRSPEPDALSIYEASVSRRHARLFKAESAWMVEDLGSANGTFVDVRPAREPIPVATGNRLRFGLISFYFPAEASNIGVPLNPRELAQTDRPDRTTRIKLFEPSGGGGGVVEVDGRAVHLTLAQYELVQRLIARKRVDDGYVSADELVGVLSLDALQPDHDNVRQLVRRVRRRFIDIGIGDIIENKYGVGYRLTVKVSSSPSDA